MDYIAKWLRFNLLSVLILSGVSAFGVELEPKMVRDFSAGLITAQDSTLIPDGAAQDLENVDVDSGSIEKRRGSIKANSSTLGAYSSQAVRFIHEYTDSSNNVWMITLTSASIYGSKDGGATNQLITSTHGFTTASLIRAVNAFGSVWIVDGSTNAISWNGTSVTVQSNVPRGNVIAFWGGRLWVAGVSSTPSTLYGSKIADGTDWTQDSGLDSDAFSAVVRNQDGYQIRAIAPFGRDLLVFKDRSIDRVVVLSDGQTYQLLPITSHLGTVYPESIAVADNAIIWLAHDGYYSYNGSTIHRISEPIQPTVIGLPQLSATSRDVTETSFTSGTSSHVYTSGGSVFLSTSQFVDTTGSDFGAGTLVLASTTSTQLLLSPTSTNIPNYDLSSWYPVQWAYFTDTASDFNGTGWTCYSGSVVECAALQTSSPYQAGLQVISSTTGAILAVSTVTTTSSWVSYSFPSVAGYAGESVKLKVVSVYDNTKYILSDAFITDGSAISVYLEYIYYGAPYSYRIGVDNFTGGRTASSASIVSRAFDTSASSSYWKTSDVAYTSGGNTVSFYTQSSSDASVWETTTSWTPGTAPSSTPSRYIRYKISATGGGTTYINDVTLNSVAKSGYFQTTALSISAATSWLPFSSDHALDSGSISYILYTDTDTSLTPTNTATFTSSQTITSGGTPTLTLPANYVVVISSMLITAGTQNPQVNEYTLSWGEGSVGAIVSSLYWDGAYYSAVDSDGGGTNDTILRYDRNLAWTKYTGLPVYRFGTYRNRMYFGANNDGYIVRMQIDDRYRDYNDSAISAFWIGKDQDLGYPITTKSLLRYYLTAEYTADSTLTASYGVDRGSLTSVTYDLDSTSGFFRQTIKPSSLTYGEGIQHRFKVSNSVIDEYFKILSVTGRWNLNTNP